MKQVEQTDLARLLYWMEVNESGPFQATSPVLLSHSKSSTCKDLMFHYKHGETADQTQNQLREVLNGSFQGILSYSNDELVFLDDKDNSLKATIDTHEYATYLLIRIMGEINFVAQVEEVIKATGRTKKQPIVSRIFKTNHGFDTIDLTLPEVKAVENIQAFYPFLEQTPQQMWDEFNNSSANVLVFIGEPGTGKTSLIRQMLDHRGYETNIHLVDNETTLLDPELMGYVQSDAEIRLLVTEDADRFVAKREDHNASMVGLLNASSGLAGGRVKFLISTNLKSLNSVDEALIRPGRCHKVIQFKKLTPDQANEARLSSGLEPMHFEDDVTLAQALNGVNNNTKMMRKVGFI